MLLRTVGVEGSTGVEAELSTLGSFIVIRNRIRNLIGRYEHGISPPASTALGSLAMNTHGSPDSFNHYITGMIFADVETEARATREAQGGAPDSNN